MLQRRSYSCLHAPQAVACSGQRHVVDLIEDRPALDELLAVIEQNDHWAFSADPSAMAAICRMLRRSGPSLGVRRHPASTSYNALTRIPAMVRRTISGSPKTNTSSNSKGSFCRCKLTATLRT